MRRFMLMEVCEADTWSDVDGNTVYFPVDGGRGELMWLRKDRVIECADEGPCYRVPKEGDTTISTNPFIPYKAKLDWPYNVHRCLCFPAPEREETTPRNIDGQCVLSVGRLCDIRSDKKECTKVCTSCEYWQPQVDPAEWCGGAMGGVL